MRATVVQIAIWLVQLPRSSVARSKLQAGTPFLVSEDDCTHAGNRDVGRDRVIVTWQDTAASATQSDHLDIRYCK
jgi:hypothetical protein